MLTEKQMLEIAEKYLKRMGGPNEIELVILKTIKKPYGNIYIFNSKKYIETGDFGDAVIGNAPFLVEKENRRVVRFGTAGMLEDQLIAYEKGTMIPSLHTYWYPDEDRFSHE